MTNRELEMWKEDVEFISMLQKKSKKARKLINEYIEELSWVENTDEELRNVKIINRLKKILKELD